MRETEDITRIIGNIFMISVNPSAWIGIGAIVLFFMFAILFVNAVNKSQGNESEHISMFSLLAWLPICIIAMIITVAVFV